LGERGGAAECAAADAVSVKVQRRRLRRWVAATGWHRRRRRRVGAGGPVAANCLFLLERHIGEAEERETL
jgi:hypothetical protein